MLHIPVDDELTLEMVCPPDAAALFELVDSNREHLGEFLPWVATTATEYDTLLFIKNSCMQMKEMSGINYKILFRGVAVGLIGFVCTNLRTKTFEIGYWIKKDMSGQGIISRLVPVTEHICFSYFNANKLEIRCATKNTASNRIAIKCKYRLEGTITNCELIDEKFLDYNVYGKKKKRN